MIDILLYFVSLIIGIVLGIIYFGGLYLTLRFTPRVRHPILLVVGSYFGRLALFAICASLVAYYWSILHILTLLVGTIFARFIQLRMIRFESKSDSELKTTS